MRIPILLVVAMALLAAGCAGPAAPATQAPGEAAFASERGTYQVTGQYTRLMPLGQPVQERGGETAMQVAGWRDAQVSFEANIELEVALLPPGCERDAPCMLRFELPDGATSGAWGVPALPAGTWTVVVQADPADYSYVDGLYSLRIDYTVA